MTNPDELIAWADCECPAEPGYDDCHCGNCGDCHGDFEIEWCEDGEHCPNCCYCDTDEDEDQDDD